MYSARYYYVNVKLTAAAVFYQFLLDSTKARPTRMVPQHHIRCSFLSRSRRSLCASIRFSNHDRKATVYQLSYIILIINSSLRIKVQSSTRYLVVTQYQRTYQHKITKNNKNVPLKPSRKCWGCTWYLVLCANWYPLLFTVILYGKAYVLEVCSMTV